VSDGPEPGELWDPATRRDPHDFYDRVRRAGRPVLQVDPSGQRVWVVAGYDDVLAGLHNPDLGHEVHRHRNNGGCPVERVDRPQAGRGERVASRQLISLDPPDHTRLRRLVSPDFTARAVAALEPTVRTVAEELVAGCRARGTFDAVTDLADPLPVNVIAALVGVPADDRPRFRAWSAQIVSGQDPWGAATDSFLDYVDALADHRRDHPADDLLTRLVDQEQPTASCPGTGALDRDELLAMVQLLLVAGQETTVDVVANALRLLLSVPERWHSLVADPATAAAVVEETLRFRGPVEMVPPRNTFAPVTLGGGTVPPYELVGLSLWGANRDPAVFERPHEFDVGRPDVGRHLAFGHGAHFCLGASLGRLEARLMLEHVARQLPDLELTVPAEDVAGFRLHHDALPLRVGGCRSVTGGPMS
jgi:cytochrome P450